MYTIFVNPLFFRRPSVSMKPKSRFLIIILIIVLIMFLGFLYKPLGYDSKFPEPDEIIVYKYDSKTKTISKTNKSFYKILKLIDLRFAASNNMTIKAEDNTSFYNSAKNNWNCIEFIYNNPVTLSTDKNLQCSFKKAFFLINAEASTDYCSKMIYGNDSYTASLEGLSIDSKIMIKLKNIVELFY